MRSSLLLPLLALACTAPRTAPSPSTRFDLVIANGKIVDGTGNAWFYGDVGLVGQRIAVVAPAGSLRNATATRVVDANGLVVAPGFIDIQGQSVNALTFGDGRLVGKVTQGVTTEILGEGSTPAPVNDSVFRWLDIPDSAAKRVAAY